MKALLKFIFNKFEVFSVLSASKKISQIEREFGADEAKVFRQELLTKIKFKNSAPIWLLEGRYLFDKKKDYQNALVAYENAIKAFKMQPLHYGSINPIEIYYGAAASSVLSNNIKEGKVYYDEFLDYYRRFSENNELKKTTDKWLQGKEWLAKEFEKVE